MNDKFVIGKNVEMQIINKNQLNELIDFQKEIINNMISMGNKGWFMPLTEEEFLNAINGKDNAYFLIYKKEIIGLLVLTCDVPDVLEEYQLPNDNYMLIDSMMIKSNYRGYGLQKQMLKYAYQRAIDLEKDGLVATIHPDNKYSLNNFVDEKYELLNVLTIHSGIRNIMIKSIDK